MTEKGRVASFKELRCEGTKTGSGAVDIIFVHGLASNRTTTFRRSHKDWLRELKKTTNGRISIYGFNAAELLTGGKERLFLLADELQKNILQLRGTEKPIFIGHGLAGWVVQESLTRPTAADIAWHTKGVMFLGLPSCKDEADWDRFSQNFLNLYTKTTNLRCTLEFAKLKVVEANFESLRKSSYGPRAYYVPRSSGNAVSNSASEVPQSEKWHTIRRHTFSARSSGSDSSLSETNAEELSLPNIKFGDNTYAQVVSFLKEAVAYEKPAPNFDTLTVQPISHQTSSSAVQFSPKSTAITISGSSRSSKYFRRGSSMLFLEDPPSQDPPSQDPPSQDPPSQDQNSNDSEYNAKNENEIPERQANGVNEMVRFAALYQQSGELRKARALYETAKAEIARGGVPSDPDVIGIIDIIDSQIAVTSLLGGHFKDAEKTWLEMEPRLRSTFGEHERTWEVSRWLAVSFDMQGQYLQARQKLEQVLKTKDITNLEPYAEASKVILLTKSTLALVMGHLGDYKGAMSLSQTVLHHARMFVERAARDDVKRVAEIGDDKESASLGRMLSAVQLDSANILACVGQLNEANSINDEALKGMERYYGNKYVATLDGWSLKAHLLALEGRIDEAGEQCQKTLKAMRREIGKEHPSTLRTLGISVFICRKRARLADALQIAKYLVDKSRSNGDIGPQHPQMVSSMAQLADVYVARGQLEEALSIQKTVVELSQRHLGLYHPTTLSYRSDLANIYCCQGSWNTAYNILLEVFWRQYTIYLCITGVLDKNDEEETHLTVTGPFQDIQSLVDKLRDVLHSLRSDDQASKKIYLPLISTMHRLAVSEREREHGDLELARELLMQVAKYRQDRLLADHDDTLAALLDLALIDRKESYIHAAAADNEMLSAAAESLERIASIRRGLLGVDHPDTLAARHELSVTRFQLEFEIANQEIADEQEEILQLRIHILGNGHPDTVRSYIELSKVYHSMGDLKRAEALQLDALKAQIDLYPSPILMDEAKKSYEAALEVLELTPKVRTNGTDVDINSLDITGNNETTNPPKNLYRPCHFQIISSLAALASLYFDKEDFGKAATLQEAVVSQHQRTYRDPNHPTTLQSISTLAQIYQALDNIPSAITLYNQILSSAHKLSPLYFDTQSSLGSLYFSISDFQKAEDIQKQAYEEQKSKFVADKEDPEALVIAMYNLALTKKELGRAEQAMGLMEKVLRLGERELGEEHARTREVRDTLGRWRKEGEGEGGGEVD